MQKIESRGPARAPVFRSLALASAAASAEPLGLGDLLRTFRADAVYERAEGDYLFQRRGEALVPVFDLIGGFGANLLGHNHPDIVAELRRLLDAQVPFSAQASARPGVAELERRLRARLGTYRLVVTNSGTETIEAALKHAYLERRQETFWAVRGSFHGKTLGSIQLTYRHGAPFRSFGPRVRFLDPWDASSWHDRDAGRVSGAVIEPILGEGGIVPLPDDFLRWLGGVCRRWGIPLIVDEIQTGMGRTGTFLAAETFGLDPDYICLSKALGGGMAKIGALLIRDDRFIEAFSLLHSSTFAGDEISCRIACRALDVTERDAIPDRCNAAGTYLLRRLSSLRERYPEQIREIRGRGLLIGIELGDPSHGGSKILRAIAQHDLLGNIASSYFLNVHDLRIAPSLSSPATLRVEPSAYVDLADLDRFVDALETFCRALRLEDVPHVVGHLVGQPRGAQTESSPPSYKRLNREKPETSRRVAFIAHAIDAEDLRSWDPSLASFDVAVIDDFVRKATQFLGPVSYDELHVRSPFGKRVHLSVIGLFYTSEHLFRAYRSRDRERVLEQIERAVDLARDRGCSVAGLGGFHSIISSNGERLRAPSIGITSGNALTVGMGVRALTEAAERVGIETREATLGVVGATGNIAQAYALLMAPRVRHLVLMTRPGGARRCAPLVRELRELAPWIEPEVSETPEALRSCSLILSASNAAEPVIHARHLGRQRTVICDISLPPDVAPDVRRERSDVVVLKGGVVRLPCDPDLIIPGLPLAPGHVFACMAETLLMGLEDVEGHGSYGALTPARVQWALDMADKHGFALAELQTTSLL